MKINTLSISKNLDPSEDVVVALESKIIGIFDGASTNNKIKILGQSPGRLAASKVANLSIEYRKMIDEGLVFDINNYLEYIVFNLKKLYMDIEVVLPYPATTGALVLIVNEICHFLIIGDTGIRINKKYIFKN